MSSKIGSSIRQRGWVVRLYHELSSFVWHASLITLHYAGSASVPPIHWYIMTSPFTDEPTRKFFESHKYFGLEADQVRTFWKSDFDFEDFEQQWLSVRLTGLQVTFFQQGTIPCVSRDGRFIMETPYRVGFVLNYFKIYLNSTVTWWVIFRPT